MKIFAKTDRTCRFNRRNHRLSAPLTIEQQGTFAVGGTVVTSKGEFKMFYFICLQQGRCNTE